VTRYLALLEGFAAFTQDKELASPKFELPANPEDTLKPRKEANTIESLAPLLTRLEKKKDAANECVQVVAFSGALGLPQS